MSVAKTGCFDVPPQFWVSLSRLAGSCVNFYLPRQFGGGTVFTTSASIPNSVIDDIVAVSHHIRYAAYRLVRNLYRLVRPSGHVWFVRELP